MCACASRIDRLLKLRYLDEKGADCLAEDTWVGLNVISKNLTNFVGFIQEKKTALFYAVCSFAPKDDISDVLPYLVIEKGIDVNSVSTVTFFKDLLSFSDFYSFLERMDTFTGSMFSSFLRPR